MKTTDFPPQKPALIKGFLWSIFAMSATLCAFVLPAYILGDLLIQQKILKSNASFTFNPSWFFPLLSLLFLAAVYFSLYRFAVFIEDVNLHKAAKIIKILFTVIFIACFLSLIILNLKFL